MIRIKAGQKFGEIAKEHESEFDSRIALALFNNKLRELSAAADEDGVVEFITINDKHGIKTYRRTLIFIMQVALFNIMDGVGTRARVLQTNGNGKYVELMGEKTEVTDEILSKLQAEMTRIIDAKMPITKTTYKKEEAMKLFDEYGMTAKKKLFEYRRSSTVNLYELDGYQNYFYGYMLDTTADLKFGLEKYQDGFMLQYVDKTTGEVSPLRKSDKLFATQRGSTRWAESLGIKNVGELNEAVVKGEIADIILLQEAEMEERIGNLAREIVEAGGKKFIMIAGPSSSGKTSFSNRLSLQLRAKGLKPHPIPLDNYYLDREFTPRDENGNYDFECLEALDVELFNQDMGRLLNGEKVELPVFNFKSGKREYRGNYMQLGEDDVLVIEGIHGLNDKLSYSLPKECKYKIYISALTQISLDNHNALATTDGRLLRRIVRDARTRGTSARETIAMWDSVRRGEEKYIFPFQEEADHIFNSALIYELAVLKVFAEPQLFNIPKDCPEYLEAHRLLKLLDYFIAVPGEDIHHNSLVREFIGGSLFNV